MNQTPESDHLTLFCACCAAELTPGTGDFYVLQIEASADPTPPRFSEDDMERAHAGEIERLLEQMRHMSQQELMDQVYRRLILCLCIPANSPGPICTPGPTCASLW